MYIYIRNFYIYVQIHVYVYTQGYDSVPSQSDLAGLDELICIYAYIHIYVYIHVYTIYIYIYIYIYRQGYRDVPLWGGYD